MWVAYMWAVHMRRSQAASLDDYRRKTTDYRCPYTACVIVICYIDIRQETLFKLTWVNILLYKNQTKTFFFQLWLIYSNSLQLKDEVCFSLTGGARGVSAEAHRRKERQVEIQLPPGGGTSFPYCSVCKPNNTLGDLMLLCFWSKAGTGE